MGHGKQARRIALLVRSSETPDHARSVVLGTIPMVWMGSILGEQALELNVPESSSTQHLESEKP